MSDRIFQIVYCSRNNLLGSEAEVEAQIEKILADSRRNNTEAGVTGALFYNKVFFAQVLEGSFAEVQRVFERLQLDPRHADLVVLQSGYASGRDFGNWGMAFAGSSPELALPPDVARSEGGTFRGASESGSKVLALLRDVVAQQEGWALPERPSSVRPGRGARATATL